MQVEVLPPMFIGARLMPAYKIGDVGTIHIEPASYDDRGCLSWHYIVTDAAGKVLCEQSDIQDGAGVDVNVTAVTESLLGFMGAAGEAYEHEMRAGAGSSENGRLFPPVMMEWCYAHAEQIEEASYELTIDRSEG